MVTNLFFYDLYQIYFTVNTGPPLEMFLWNVENYPINEGIKILVIIMHTIISWLTTESWYYNFLSVNNTLGKYDGQ